MNIDLLQILIGVGITLSVIVVIKTLWYVIEWWILKSFEKDEYGKH
jgi:uncharacterized membrane protein YwzB